MAQTIAFIEDIWLLSPRLKEHHQGLEWNCGSTTEDSGTLHVTALFYSLNSSKEAQTTPHKHINMRYTSTQQPKKKDPTKTELIAFVAPAANRLTRLLGHLNTKDLRTSPVPSSSWSLQRKKSPYVLIRWKHERSHRRQINLKAAWFWLHLFLLPSCPLCFSVDWSSSEFLKKIIPWIQLCQRQGKKVVSKLPCFGHALSATPIPGDACPLLKGKLKEKGDPCCF